MYNFPHKKKRTGLNNDQTHETISIPCLISNIIINTLITIFRKRYLEAHPDAAEAWFRENASLELRQRFQGMAVVQAKSPLKNIHQEENLLSRSKRNSVTSDLFQSWLASSSPAKRSKSPSR